MSTSRLHRTLAVTVGIALVLTACGRDAQSTAGDAASDLGAISESPATGDITIWAMGLEGEQLPALAETFSAENPDAQVTITAVPWDDAPTKISTAIASGQTPDATLLNPSALASFVASGGFATVPDGVIDESAFDPNTIAATKVDGAAYAVPLYVDTRTLFYRKDFAEAAGVAAPTNWAEWAGFARALQTAGATQGMLLPTGEIGFTEQVLIPFIWGAGGQILDSAGAEFTLDTPETVAGLNQYQSFFTEGVASRTGTYEPWGSVEQRMVDGEVGSAIEGPWLVPALKELLGERYESTIGVATLPAGPASGASWLDGGQLAVFRDAKNPEGAWKFLKFLSETENAAEFSRLTGDLPAVTAAWGPAGLDADPTTAVFSEQMKDTGLTPAIASWNEAATVFAGYGERLARGTTTPEEAAAGLQTDLSGIGIGG
jgi:multiple sugar transport system substrate-binding protein